MDYPQPAYTIWSRKSAGNVDGTAFQRIQEVQDWSKLSVDLKWSDTSTWSLTLPFEEYIKRWEIPATITSGTLISDGYGLRGILIFRNGGTWPTASTNGNLLLSGVITNGKRKWAGDDDTVTLTGESDTYYLKTRMIWPAYDHMYDAGRYWAGVDTVKHYLSSLGYTTTIPIETIMRTWVDNTMGSLVPVAYPTRKLPFFSSGTNLARGDTAKYATRFETLYDMCQSVTQLQTSNANYYGWDIVQTGECGPYRLLFRFLVPRDMTYGAGEAIFGTELGTISKFEYNEKAPPFNSVVVSGPMWDGQATSSDPLLTMYYAADNVASRGLYGRIEGFATNENADDTPTTAEIIASMLSTGTQEIKQNSYNQSAEVDLDMTQCNYFMSNYQLGDLVTVEIGGFQYTDYIRQIKITAGPEGEVVKPTCCDPMFFQWSGGVTHRLAAQYATKLKNIQRGN